MNGKEITNMSDISNQFVEFFTNVGRNLDKKIPITGKNPIDYIKCNNTRTLFLNPCDEEEIIK